MLTIYKYHGSHNSFFLLDQTLLKQPLTDEQLSYLAIKITRANFVNGADGLLVVEEDRDALGRMKIFNADGSTALMCGNGLRIVARYLSRKYKQTKFLVATPRANLRVKVATDLAPQVPSFDVEISPVSLETSTLPSTNLPTNPLINERLPALDTDLNWTAISVPNPHLISFVDSVKKYQTRQQIWGAYLNRENPYFPQGINLSLAQIIAPKTLFVQTYERGVGFTNACGTAMSAASLALILNYPQLADYEQQITVYNAGGLVHTIVHQGTNPFISLIGNATLTHRIQLSENELLSSLQPSKIFTTSEEISYRNYVDTKKELGLDTSQLRF